MMSALPTTSGSLGGGAKKHRCRIKLNLNPNGGARVEFNFETVLSGAGISTSWPSSLPSGDALAGLAWVRMLTLLRTHGDESDALLSSAEEALNLRLEHFMELCAQNGMSGEAVESAYAFMATSKHNSSHELLAALPRHTHLTLNVDTLLEKAGMKVVHLHGQVDRPGSIMTTVSQYTRGLPSEVKTTLIHAVRDKDVLAVGYSGRDLDVFPTIVRSVPRSLLWLRHPRSEHFPEVDNGLQQLRGAGCDVIDEEGELKDFVESCVRTPVPVESDSSEDFRPPTLGDECFAGVASVVLRRTLASALFDSGALALLDAIEDNEFSNQEDQVLLRKLHARSARQQGNTGRALRLLIVPPRARLAPLLWRSGVGEISSLLARSGHPRVSSTLDRLLLRAVATRTDVTARRAAVTLRVRLAQHESVAGRLEIAASLIAPIVDGEASKTQSTSGEVDALTWAIDVLKAQGRFVEAHRLAAHLEDISPFGNSSQKAFAYWQLGQVFLLQGNAGRAVAFRTRISGPTCVSGEPGSAGLSATQAAEEAAMVRAHRESGSVCRARVVDAARALALAVGPLVALGLRERSRRSIR